MRKISLFGKELQLQSHFCSPTGGVECGLKKYNLYIEAGGVCPARCSFCTGYRNKYHVDIDKLQYVISQLSEKNLINRISITGAEPFVYHDLDGIMLVLRKRDFANGTVKINYTRMGEPFLNIEAVREAIEKIDSLFPGTHHYISTIGIKGSDFSWIKDNITLQLSLHSLDEERRNNLIPIRRKMTIKELGEVRTQSFLKTTLNLTMAAQEDWDINELKKFFDKDFFFVKVSPINPNEISEKNGMGKGIIQASVRDLCGT